MAYAPRAKSGDKQIGFSRPEKFHAPSPYSLVIARQIFLSVASERDPAKSWVSLCCSASQRLHPATGRRQAARLPDVYSTSWGWGGQC